MPNEPCGVSATMRCTPSISAKTWNGKSILSFMRHLLRHDRLDCAIIHFQPRLVDRADHVQRTLRHVLELVAQDALAAVERIIETDEFALDAAELFGGEEWLGEETFQPPRACDHGAICCRQLFQPEHGDDVLEVRVLRERAP